MSETKTKSSTSGTKKKKRKYVYHYETKNDSFIKMAKLLKSMGIKNYKFFLKLYDEKLRDVDPHDENLSPEIVTRIGREIRRNVWYYLREVVRIPVPGNPEGKRYELHRGNLALTWLQINNINCAEELPRQNGKTISAECNFIYFYNYGTTNSQIAFFNKRYDDSKMNLQRFKDIRDALPVYLRAKSSKDKDNLTYVRSKDRKNDITAMPTANDPDAADKLGRGSTQPLIVVALYFYREKFS